MMMNTPNFTLLAVFAHPDDETLEMAGTLARYAAEGRRTILVCCTRGEAGGIMFPAPGPSFGFLSKSRSKVMKLFLSPRLGAIREAELRAAAAVLGITEVHILPYRDSGMAGAPIHAKALLSRYRLRLVNARLPEAAHRLARIICETRPHVVVTHDEHGGYGHPDHVIAHRITCTAIDLAASGHCSSSPWQVQKLYYPVRSLSLAQWVDGQANARGLQPPHGDRSPIWRYAKPDEEITTRIDVRAYQDTIRLALAAHRSQMPADPAIFALPPDLVAIALGTNCYIREFARVTVPPEEHDLFAGLLNANTA